MKERVAHLPYRAAKGSVGVPIGRTDERVDVSCRRCNLGVWSDVFIVTRAIGVRRAGQGGRAPGDMDNEHWTAVTGGQAMIGTRWREISSMRQGVGCDHFYYDPYRRSILSWEEALYHGQIPHLYSDLLPREYSVIFDEVVVRIAN